MRLSIRSNSLFHKKLIISSYLIPPMRASKFLSKRMVNLEPEGSQRHFTMNFQMGALLEVKYFKFITCQGKRF